MFKRVCIVSLSGGIEEQGGIAEMELEEQGGIGESASGATYIRFGSGARARHGGL